MYVRKAYTFIQSQFLLPCLYCPQCVTRILAYTNAILSNTPGQICLLLLERSTKPAHGTGGPYPLAVPFSLLSPRRAYYCNRRCQAHRRFLSHRN